MQALNASGPSRTTAPEATGPDGRPAPVRHGSDPRPARDRHGSVSSRSPKLKASIPFRVRYKVVMKIVGPEWPKLFITSLTVWYKKTVSLFYNFVLTNVKCFIATRRVLYITTVVTMTILTSTLKIKLNAVNFLMYI